jgi:hypothetical protein
MTVRGRIAAVRPPTWLLFPVATLALLPLPVSGQVRGAARTEVVWHWFAVCASGDSLILEIRLDGQGLYSATFPICQVRRGDIKPDPQQRLLAFRFNAVPRRFRGRDPARDMQPIAGNVWEAGRKPDAILLGISFSTDQQVLLNTVHPARADAASRTEQIRGLVVTTRPVQRSDRTPLPKRSKRTGGTE